MAVWVYVSRFHGGMFLIWRKDAVMLWKLCDFFCSLGNLKWAQCLFFWDLFIFSFAASRIIFYASYGLLPWMPLGAFLWYFYRLESFSFLSIFFFFLKLVYGVGNSLSVLCLYSLTSITKISISISIVWMILNLLKLDTFSMRIATKPTLFVTN